MKTTHEKIIIGCGVWLLALSFSGFPQAWKTAFMVATGLAVIYFGAIVLKKAHEYRKHTHHEMKTETFTETVNPE
jgi:hypothetical protein